MDTGAGKEGDRVTLWSPVLQLESNTSCVSYWIRAKGDGLSNVNTLKLYLVDADFAFGTHLLFDQHFLSNDSYVQWTEMISTIPLFCKLYNPFRHPSHSNQFKFMEVYLCKVLRVESNKLPRINISLSVF